MTINVNEDNPIFVDNIKNIYISSNEYGNYYNESETVYTKHDNQYKNSTPLHKAVYEGVTDRLSSDASMSEDIIQNVVENDFCYGTCLKEAIEKMINEAVEERVKIIKKLLEEAVEIKDESI